MPKKKLIHFTENLAFPHLFQPRYPDLLPAFRMKSLWRKEFFGNSNPITVELGCGKGEYTVSLAEHYPGRNFIGLDLKGARLWKGCKTVTEKGLKNVAFIRSQVNHLPYLFASGEVNEIWITFPDPQPKRERKRLTSPGFMGKYREILSPGGTLHLKTDDRDFYDYTLEVIASLGMMTLFSTDDLYNSGFTGDVTKVRTHYENIWLEKGKKICYLVFSF